jgi:uncharacterized membrane protein/glutaredoxin
MAKPAKNKKPNLKADKQALLRDGPNWLLLILAVIGMGLTAYLTYTAWQGKLVAGCAEGSACDIVLNSRWSTLLGVPTSFWGFLTYALLAATAWNRYADSQWKFAWFVTIIGLFYSLYLTGISFFVLQATCPYCLSSLGLMALIFVTLLLQKPTNLPRFSWGGWLGKTVGAAFVIVLALHLHYAGYLGKAPGPEDPWIRGLAEHLTRTNAKFYGASWCPHCTDQKKLFGSSERRLPYVECASAGPGSKQTAVCNEVGIKTYPTWVINGQRYTGTQNLDALAQYSNYKSAEVKP